MGVSSAPFNCRRRRHCMLRRSRPDGNQHSRTICSNIKPVGIGMHCFSLVLRPACGSRLSFSHRAAGPQPLLYVIFTPSWLAW